MRIASPGPARSATEMVPCSWPRCAGPAAFPATWALPGTGVTVDLNAAFRIATRNTIEFLQRRAGLTALDAYCLASIGVSFRVTQFVNQNHGVHALIPKALFSTDRRLAISIV